MTPAADLVERLAGRTVIVCCGSGGVGKTTVSAALGMAIASGHPKRVLVLTIDPARRLATALGLASIGTTPAAVSAERLVAAGMPPRGELVAAMLDPRSEWERMVERNARDPELRDRILSNPFYREVSGGFAGSQEYMALEALHGFHAGGEYDCIVVDTPPSRSALDLLEAPDRVTDLVAGRLLGWLAGPSRFGWRAMDLAAAPFLRMADRLLGGQVLEELAAFIRDIQGLYGGVRQRAGEVRRLLRSPSTAFVVVTTLEPEPFAEAEFLCRRLRERSLPLGAVVVNRVLPAALEDPAAVRAATKLTEDPEAASWLAGQLARPVAPEVPGRLGRAFLTLHLLAERDAAQSRRLGRLGRAPVARIPLASEEIDDLTALGRLSVWLRGGDVVMAARPSRA